MENQKATLEPWLKEFEKRFIGYEKVSGGIGLSYVTDVDNPYLKNDISGIKDFIQETLSNREKEIAEEVEKKRKEPNIFNEKVCIKKNGVNQKSSQVITIKITYGSGFQKTYGNEMLVTLLKTFNSYFSKSHKENSFSVTTKSV